MGHRLVSLLGTASSDGESSGKFGGEDLLVGGGTVHTAPSVPRTNVACGFPALRSTERLPVNTGPQTDDELQDDDHGCASGAGVSVFPAGTCHATSALLNHVRIPSLPRCGPPSHHQRRLSAPLVPHALRHGPAVHRYHEGPDFSLRIDPAFRTLPYSSVYPSGSSAPSEAA